MKSQAVKPNPFVVVFRGRCGSTYLMEALGNHPAIETSMEKLAALKQKKKGPREQRQWIRDYFSQTGTNAGLVARGFKTKLQDVLDPHDFGNLLRELEVRIIHIRRRNCVKSTVSFFNSVRLNEMTGDWNLYSENDRLPPLTIDVARFDQWLQGGIERNAKELAFVEGLGLPTLTVYYESVLQDESGTFEKIFSFLGVSHQPVKGQALKSTSDDLRQVLANFEELRAHYEGTEYQAMFDEVLVTSR